MAHSQPSVVRWRPDALADELAEPLGRLRAGLLASDALVVFTPTRQQPRVIAWHGPGEPLFTADEPVELNTRWAPRPYASRDVRVASVMRPVGLDFASAAVVPFVTSDGRGLVILGSGPTPTSPGMTPGSTPDEAATAQVEGLARQLESLRGQSGATRHGDVDRAYRMVARAASSELSPDQVLDVTLAAARMLVGAEVAYLGLPVDDEHFYFHRSLGIRTREFLELRVAWGEGLGGAARALERPIRSLNYQDDANLHHAPVQVTRQEGIYSALAVPVRDQGAIQAVLYVGSREPRAYSEEDERILADFSGATQLALERADLEEVRTARIREQERARIARSLHDDLIRRLTSIGFVTDQLQQQVGDDLAGQLAALNTDLGAAMDLVRDELRHLVSSTTPADQSLAEVAEAIMAVPSLAGLHRSTSFSGMDAGRAMVSAEVAQAMTRVGQEAVFNAEHHSGGSRCWLALHVGPTQCTLTISDDGTAERPGHPREGHFGLDLIRREVQRVGGVVAFGQGPGGGLEVQASFPLVGAGW